MTASRKWIQEYAAEDAPVSWTDPADTVTRGAAAAWIQALESGDLTVTLDGGDSEELSFSAGETKSGPFVAVSASDIDFVAGNGAVPVVPGGDEGDTGPTGPTGPTGATGSTGPTGPNLTPVATTAATFSAAIDTMIPVDSSGGAFTVTLPALSSGNSGHRIVAHQVTTSATAVTFVPTGSDTINGLTSTTIAASKGTKVFYADFPHTDWWF